ncbi:DUF4114 domain-containing protein [Polaribacter septentrionalilitoris]|uniref:DUF4114 domain-containing protein n=1 Tax=Polaribacter septentrionalilitoris TaxID=2494657 RepID=UPI00135A4BDE|nr:DUF4114 domain-containing protein [Polaribacter septentrionalilitoris]
MKKILLILISTVVTSLNAQTYNYLGEFTSDGTPMYLESPGDIVSTETLQMIDNSLPENYPVPTYNPQYITSGYETDIKVESKADIWVTFVSEGAGYRNVLGFYTYPLDNPPTTKPSKEDITIIFPNVSALGSGGGLKVGDKVKIGTFEAGTGIGWVLLANAWNSRNAEVGDGHWQLFSNTNFNPEAKEELRHHNVLLADPDNERVILGFEDIRRDYSSCDNDFNDAIFYVTANPYTAIKINNFADISEANDVTSGNDGGLESNGSLANLIAKRNFKRKKDGNALNLSAKQQAFKKSVLRNKGNSSSLIEYVPETGMYSTEIAKVSSPKDLIAVTNAKEIFSVDYYSGDKRVSAVLATQTEGSIYDHSKMICDRLNSSSLEDVRTVTTRGHQIISSKILRATGEKEYTLSFSIKLNDGENELFSFWNIDQYPAGNYQNFQIWGSSFSQVFAIANFIIDKHTSENGLKSTVKANVVPNVFVKSGTYANGFLTLNIINKTKEKEVLFEGNISRTEVSKYSNEITTLSLSGDYEEEITIDTGVLFDIGFSIQASENAQKDALYLADGPWGLDYLNEYATVNDFYIDASDDLILDDEMHHVDRNVSVSGSVKGNINLFRHILPGDQTLDVTNYDALQFKMMNTQSVEIVIMQEEDRDWNDRIRYTIPANTSEKEHNISFTNFKDASGNTVEISNIKTVVFSIISNYEDTIPFNLDIKEVAFGVNEVLSVNGFSSDSTQKVMNYPNPFTNRTTIKLFESSKSVKIQVFDLMGRSVDVQYIDTDSSTKKVQYNAPNLKAGMYKYLLKDDENRIHSGTFIVR